METTWESGLTAIKECCHWEVGGNGVGRPAALRYKSNVDDNNLSLGILSSSSSCKATIIMHFMLWNMYVSSYINPDLMLILPLHCRCRSAGEFVLLWNKLVEAEANVILIMLPLTCIVHQSRASDAYHTLDRERAGIIPDLMLILPLHCRCRSAGAFVLLWNKLVEAEANAILITCNKAE